MPQIGLFFVHVDNVVFAIRDYALSIQGSALQNTANLSILGNAQLLSIFLHFHSNNKFLSCCVTRSYSKVSSRIMNA